MLRHRGYGFGVCKTQEASRDEIELYGKFKEKLLAEINQKLYSLSKAQLGRFGCTRTMISQI